MDNTQVKAGSLRIAAIQKPTSSGASLASASSIAAVGALLGSVDSTTSEVSTSGTVMAYTGSNVRLPDGDTEIAATSQTAQSADATGVAAGVLAVGANFTQADSDMTVSAALGENGSTTAGRTGRLVVIAMSENTNSASSIAGSGGVVSGDGASSSTSDMSQVSTS
ncbi:MAG: hypothetical protein NT069_12800, partial [Planctomycetota bacterium]|nr:hypothetical protein [Planctomycetota bacterium]